MIKPGSRVFTVFFVIVIVLTFASLALGFIESREIEQKPVDRDYAPTVKLNYPKGGETINGTILIKWRGYDKDGNKITYNVSYSSDGGSTWTVLVTGLPMVKGTDWMGLRWNTTKVPDGSEYLIQVNAADRYYITSETTEEFFTIDNSGTNTSVSVPNPPPVVTPEPPPPVEVEISEWNIGLDQKIRFTLETTLNGTEVRPVEILAEVKVEIDSDEIGYAQMEDNSSSTYFIYVKDLTSQSYEGIVIATDIFDIPHTASTRFSFIHWRTYASIIAFPLILILYVWKRFLKS